MQAERFERPKESGIRSGFYDLDKMTSGFQRSDLVIVAGRPSMGKTSLATDFSRAMAKQGPGLFLSLEMSSDQLADRNTAAVARVDLQKIRSGKLDKEELARIAAAQSELARMPILVDDEPSMDVGKIHLKLIKNVFRNKIRWMIVDYLQLIESEGRSRDEEVSKITRKLKQYAKEFNMPIIALSQLNRQCEARSDKKPLLSDLRESGAIEQDADLIMFVWRGEHYWPEDENLKGTAEILIRKHRNGPTGTVTLAWLGQYSSFSNMARR